MAEILCFRHGQASFASDDYDQLSELGYQQARLLGEYLVKTGVKFERIFAGTLKRQIQTAEAVVAVYQENAIDLPEIVCDARWNELQTEQQVQVLVPHVIHAMPELESVVEAAQHDKKAFQKLIRATFDFWIENPHITGDGSTKLESWGEASGRVAEVLADTQKLNQRGQRTGVFSSGGILAIVAAQVQGMPPSQVYPLFEKVINCSITRLIHNRQQIELSTFNEYSYLSAMAKPGDEQRVISYR